MPLTKDFKETIKARAERDPEFRVGLFREAIEAMLSDDLETGKVLLRDYVNATVGFETLAEDMDKDPKSLMRMLSAKGNPRADNLLAMVSRLKQREGVSFSISIYTESSKLKRLGLLLGRSMQQLFEKVSIKLLFCPPKNSA